MTEAKYVIAGWDWDAEGNDELALKAGDVIKLISKHNDNWWEGELDSRRGLFPASYVRVLENVLEENSTQELADTQTGSLAHVYGNAIEREVQQMYSEEVSKDQDVRINEYSNEDGTNYHLQNQAVEESVQYISELRYETLYYEQENFIEQQQEPINVPSYNKHADQESNVDHIKRSNRHRPTGSEGHQLSVEHVEIQHNESQSTQEITEDVTAEPIHHAPYDREIHNDSNNDAESVKEDSSEEEQADHKHYPRLLYAGEQPSQEELLLQNTIDDQGEQSMHDQYLDEQLSEDETFPEDLLREQIFEREFEGNVWDIMEHYRNREGLSDNYTDNVSPQVDADEVHTADDEGYHLLPSDDEGRYSELHSSLNVEDYENTLRAASLEQDDSINKGVGDLKLEDDYEDNPFVSSDETFDQLSQSRTTNDLEDDDIDSPQRKISDSTIDDDIYSEDGQASLYSSTMGEMAWDTSLLNTELHRKAVVYDDFSLVVTQTLQGNQSFERQVISNEHEEGTVQLPSRDGREQDDDNVILNSDATVPTDDVALDNQRSSESGDQRQRPPSVIHSQLRQLESDRNQQLNLPKGWWSSVDDSGAVFYYNEFTNESQWEMPVETTAIAINKTEEERNEEAISNVVESELMEGYGLSENINEPNYPTTEESVDLRSYSRTHSDNHHERPIPPEKVYYATGEDHHAGLGGSGDRTELSILQLDRIPAEWIHKQGFLSMKAESPEGDKLSSWKLYWVVLCDVYILFYKSSPERNKKTEKKAMPVGLFDVHKDKLELAGRRHTKQKHVFILNACDGVRIFMQAQTDNEAKGWVDMINFNQEMRRKSHESNNEPASEFRKTEKENTSLVKKKSKKFGASNVASKKRNWFFQNKPQSSNYNKRPVHNDLIFGGLLENPDGRIPQIVEQCIKVVDERGLQSVGLYRLSGNTATIQKLRNQVNDGEPVNLYDEPDINAIAGLLKLYFRELANPLIPFEYYDIFIEAAKITDYNEKMYRLHSLVHSLPQVYFETLETLMRHLSRVTSYSEENKMEPQNLAIVFAPNLIRPFEAGIEKRVEISEE
ncbi:4153_t:CDS:10 [Paraglomus brasilianum]|uniref:4153_t:CDS:1 n=1 Tax=Paraglomus brasilianum TaxID=144538 RepID=A0A9N9F8C8_9GLOM|nr:4153_t:CDS:10 [Paraglomus brasilianum]